MQRAEISSHRFREREGGRRARLVGPEMQEVGRTVKSLNVSDGFEVATGFYRSVRVDGAAQDGDGFAYSCSMPFRERGTRFELAFYRLFKSASGSFEPSRLRLSLCFNWLAVVRWLGRPDFGLPESNHYAWEPSDLARLLDPRSRTPRRAVRRTGRDDASRLDCLRAEHLGAESEYRPLQHSPKHFAIPKRPFSLRAGRRSCVGSVLGRQGMQKGV